MWHSLYGGMRGKVNIKETKTSVQGSPQTILYITTTYLGTKNHSQTIIMFIKSCLSYFLLFGKHNRRSGKNCGATLFGIVLDRHLNILIRLCQFDGINVHSLVWIQ